MRKTGRPRVDRPAVCSLSDLIGLLLPMTYTGLQRHAVINSFTCPLLIARQRPPITSSSVARS